MGMGTLFMTTDGIRTHRSVIRRTLLMAPPCCALL